MTTEEMTLLTGLQSWTELADKIVSRGWDREPVITITIDARVDYIRDEGPTSIIFDQRKVNLSTDMIKARAYDEINIKKTSREPFARPDIRDVQRTD